MSNGLVIRTNTDKVGNTFFVVNYSDDEGRDLVKTLTYEQLMTLLDNSYTEEKKKICVGQLVEGYIDSVFCTDGTGKIKMYVPAKERVFLLSVPNEKLPRAFQIPMPPMLFSIDFGGKRLGGSCCIVKGSYEEVKEQYYSRTLVGYMYPFGNVSSSTQICMGNIPYEILTAKDAPKYIEAFFDGITNADYLKESRVKSGKMQMELLGSLNGLKEFPIEELFVLQQKETDELCRPYSK